MSAGSIISGAFRLVRERPAAVAVWGFVYMVAVVGLSFAMRPVAALQGLGADANPQMMAANMSALFGRLSLFGIAFLLLFVILMTAAQRAVLRPADQGFFYIRVGMDELRMLAVALVLIISSYGAIILGAVIFGLAVALVTAGGGSVAMVAVVIIGILLMLGAMIWFQVRLSLAYPLTLIRGRIIIGESWRLTRGRFWSLFGAYFVIYLIVFAVSMVGSMVTSGAYFAELMRSAANPEAVQQAAQAQMARQFGSITVITVIGWLLSGVVGALTVGLGGGVVASAARELAPDQDMLAQTFA